MEREIHRKKKERENIRERERETDRHIKVAGASVAREQLVKDCISPG